MSILLVLYSRSNISVAQTQPTPVCCVKKQNFLVCAVLLQLLVQYFTNSFFLQVMMILTAFNSHCIYAFQANLWVDFSQTSKKALSVFNSVISESHTALQQTSLESKGQTPTQCAFYIKLSHSSGSQPGRWNQNLIFSLLFKSHYGF